MSLNELTKKLTELEQQAWEVRQQIDAALPPPVDQDGWNFSITRKGGIRIVHGEVFGKEGPATTAEVAVKVRDMLLALHPLDPAPDAGWVSVEERKPPTADPVLCYTDGNFQHTARYRTGAWKDVNMGHHIASTVTHWRELPSPPAAKGGSSE